MPRTSYLPPSRSLSHLVFHLQQLPRLPNVSKDGPGHANTRAAAAQWVNATNAPRCATQVSDREKSFIAEAARVRLVLDVCSLYGADCQHLQPCPCAVACNPPACYACSDSSVCQHWSSLLRTERKCCTNAHHIQPHFMTPKPSTNQPNPTTLSLPPWVFGFPFPVCCVAGPEEPCCVGRFVEVVDPG